MKETKTYILFKNDADLEAFAIDPNLKFLDKGAYAVSYWDWSYAYKKAMEEGKKLLMKDPNSQILKHGIIHYRTIGKKIELEEYDGRYLG